jgi:hypothetical protein
VNLRVLAFAKETLSKSVPEVCTIDVFALLPMDTELLANPAVRSGNNSPTGVERIAVNPPVMIRTKIASPLSDAESVLLLANTPAIFPPAATGLMPPTGEVAGNKVKIPPEKPPSSTVKAVLAVTPSAFVVETIMPLVPNPALRVTVAAWTDAIVANTIANV